MDGPVRPQREDKGERSDMKKILLDFRLADTPEMVQEYLALELDFPEYYGKNLDALYDCLTDIGDDTCIGVFGDDEDQKTGTYLKKVKKVMRDAEEENPHLCVIFERLEENYGEDEGLLL